MDVERLAFVFGPGFAPARWDDLLDPQDLDERSVLYEDHLPGLGDGFPRAGREVVANQIFDDEPPETWATAQRLLADGFDREQVLDQLVFVAVESLQRALGGVPLDPTAYVAALARLPLPDVEAVEDSMVELVVAEPGIGLDELVERVLEAVGAERDELLAGFGHRVADALILHGTFTLFHPDRVVHPATLAAGVVLTHRLTEAERTAGFVDVSFDLPLVAGEELLVLDDGTPVLVASGGRGDWRLVGPEGWLDGFAAGDLLALRVELPADDGPDDHDHDPEDHDGRDHGHDRAPAGLSVAVAPEPDDAATGALVARVRAVYDAEVAEPWLPVSCSELMLGLLLGDRSTFTAPRAPLSELADRAGLERRGDEVAHEASVWRSGAQMDRFRRIHDFFEDEDVAADETLFVLGLGDVAAGEDPEALGIDGLDATTLRRALAALDDELVLYVVADEVAEAAGGASEDQAWADALVEALVGAASRSREVAPARYLAARHAEVLGDAPVAEQHLVLAEKADPDNPAVIDRLGWYAADRGDAVRAARFWQRLAGTPMVDEDLEHLAPFLAKAASAGRTAPGRNDPCWCGSGRKYKQCHQGELPMPTLAERVPWLARKAAAFVTRRLDLTEDDAVEVALARTPVGSAAEDVAQAFQDPLVLDLVLTEGGWFEEFVAQRGPLLPEDELALAEQWLGVERSVYEVAATDPGATLTLRDLRTGDELVVTERTFSRTAQAGECWALRAVPDGGGHQIVGGIFPVRTGHEAAVLDLLDRGDPVEIAAWVAAQEAPDRLRDRFAGSGLVDDLVADRGGESPVG